jgi:hypothetical protein
MLAKEDTSHGFPVARPLERSSDFAVYNMNSEGWFQFWSLTFGGTIALFWLYVACYYQNTGSQSVDDEDNLRLKDGKAGMIWERCFWAFTYCVRGQHCAAL